MLKVKSLQASYGKMRILHDVSFEVPAGSITALIGPNGTGKTTTLKTIMGLLGTMEGVVQFKDQDITALSTNEIIKKGISLIPEDRKLFPQMTVQENLMLGAFNSRAWKSHDKSIQKSYRLFPRLKERRRQLARTLSGGEQRMLAIARGLASLPELLILDEPSLGLAPKIVSEIFKVLGEIRKEGVTILLVEQNVARTLQISDRAYVLENGSIVMEGGPELIRAPHIREAYLRI